MRKKNKISIEPKYIFVTCLVLCLVMILISYKYPEKVAPFKKAAGTVVTPMQNGINGIGRWLTSKNDLFASMKELQAENQALKDKVSSLSTENKTLRLEKYELDSLRELYKLDEEYAEYPKVAAHVKSKDTGNWFHVFDIDKGSNDGIKVGMNVMAGDGLVGIVTEVGHNYATVRSIIDDQSNVSAMFLKTTDTCNVKGNLELIDDGVIDLELIDKNAEIQKGYEVVTSRISDKYLPGILIGYVQDVNVDSNNLTQSGTLVPAVDFSSLDMVLVVTQLKESNY
ncbi:MAG: rod shape-determining protein MreC [Clostridiales bacterium]|nr:rod shape-determining protein MreC [Clostridiales bacterium]